PVLEADHARLLPRARAARRRRGRARARARTAAPEAPHPLARNVPRAAVGARRQRARGPARRGARLRGGGVGALQFPTSTGLATSCGGTTGGPRGDWGSPGVLPGPEGVPPVPPLPLPLPPGPPGVEPGAPAAATTTPFTSMSPQKRFEEICR